VDRADWLSPTRVREGLAAAPTGRVISHPDIFRAAKLFIDQRGDDAPMRAVERAAPGT
jgi:hypothetical protein